MASPKPVVITYGANPSPGQDPQPLVVVSEAPASLAPQEAPEIDDAPASEAAVAADLQAVVDALIAAGVFTNPE